MDSSIRHLIWDIYFLILFWKVLISMGLLKLEILDANQQRCCSLSYLQINQSKWNENLVQRYLARVRPALTKPLPVVLVVRTLRALLGVGVVDAAGLHIGASALY